jgi:two-component sensor histidine kinase
MLHTDISNIEHSQLIQFVNANISDFRNFEIAIIFKADYNQSKMIRDLTLFLFEKNSIDVPWKNRFALVSDELVNNAIEYGSLPLDKNLFKIKFSQSNEHLEVNLEVYDTGK